MAAHPRGNQSFSSSTSSRNTSRMTSGSPPPLPLFSDAISSGNSSLRSKNSTTSGSNRSSRQRSSPSLGCSSKRSDANMIALAKKAQLENDAMVYLDGPHVYTCGQCRTHLTSHDDIISKSFHGRKGEWISGLEFGYTSCGWFDSMWSWHHLMTMLDGSLTSWCFTSSCIHLLITCISHRKSIPLRPMCQHCPLPTRRPIPNHRPTHCLWHLLQTMSHSHWVDLRQSIWTESEVQGGQIHYRKDKFAFGREWWVSCWETRRWKGW